MSIMGILVDEINKDRADDEKVVRLHSEQYRIIQTDHGTFKNPARDIDLAREVAFAESMGDM